MLALIEINSEDVLCECYVRDKQVALVSKTREFLFADQRVILVNLEHFYEKPLDQIYYAISRLPAEFTLQTFMAVNEHRLQMDTARVTNIRIVPPYIELRTF
jgi:hypothetical protein